MLTMLLITNMEQPEILQAFFKMFGINLVICQHVSFLGLSSQTERLKTTEMYCLTVLEARYPPSRCWQGPAPSAASRGGSLLAFSSFWWPQVFLGL